MQCSHFNSESNGCRIVGRLVGRDDAVPIDPAACRVCIDQPSPMQPNKVTADLAMHWLRHNDPAGLADMELTLRELQGVSQPIVLGEGPGTELKRLLGRLGLRPEPGCLCLVRAAKMNRLGTRWCERNIELIVRWLGQEARRRRLPFSHLAARQLIRLAIARARKKEKV